MVNGCERENSISASTEFFNSCKMGKCSNVLGDYCAVK